MAVILTENVTFRDCYYFCKALEVIALDKLLLAQCRRRDNFVKFLCHIRKFKLTV